jgi:hypothetical protein
VPGAAVARPAIQWIVGEVNTVQFARGPRLEIAHQPARLPVSRHDDVDVIGPDVQCMQALRFFRPERDNRIADDFAIQPVQREGRVGHQVGGASLSRDIGSKRWVGHHRVELRHLRELVLRSMSQSFVSVSPRFCDCLTSHECER